MHSSEKSITFALSIRKDNIIQLKTLSAYRLAAIKGMKIENLVNARGNKVKNQFKITTKDKIYFQSYKSIVASVDRSTGRVELYKDWDCSNTTRTHLYHFLYENKHRELYNKKQVENAIKKGEVSYSENEPSL